MLADSHEAHAGQVLIAGFAAGAPPSELLALAGKGWLGGYILFKRNVGEPEAVAELNATLIDSVPAGAAPPLIAVDQEGGRVQRLSAPVVQLPPMRTLGRIDDEALTESAARLLAAQLASLGFNLDFAPVLDVDSNPDNPVIGDRSFGATPQLVVRHGRAFARGLLDGGVIACGKHFPGHGDTDVDSHLALPRLGHSLERLEAIELAPFSALRQELPAMMTAHVVFAALDPSTPATLSHAIVGDLIRQRIGFSGVVFSDDLEMRALSESTSIARSACLAIEAGCDSVLICSQPAAALEAHAALCEWAASDPRHARRLAEAAGRCLELRRAYPARRPDGVAAFRTTLARARELEQRLARATAALG